MKCYVCDLENSERNNVIQIPLKHKTERELWLCGDCIQSNLDLLIKFEMESVINNIVSSLAPICNKCGAQHISTITCEEFIKTFTDTIKIFSEVSELSEFESIELISEKLFKNTGE